MGRKKTKQQIQGKKQQERQKYMQSRKSMSNCYSDQTRDSVNKDCQPSWLKINMLIDSKKQAKLESVSDSRRSQQEDSIEELGEYQFIFEQDMGLKIFNEEAYPKQTYIEVWQNELKNHQNDEGFDIYSEKQEKDNSQEKKPDIESPYFYYNINQMEDQYPQNHDNICSEYSSYDENCDLMNSIEQNPQQEQVKQEEVKQQNKQPKKTRRISKLSQKKKSKLSQKKKSLSRLDNPKLVTLRNRERPPRTSRIVPQQNQVNQINHKNDEQAKRRRSANGAMSEKARQIASIIFESEKIMTKTQIKNKAQEEYGQKFQFLNETEKNQKITNTRKRYADVLTVLESVQQSMFDEKRIYFKIQGALRKGKENELIVLDAIYLLAQKKRLVKLLGQIKMSNPNANVSTRLIDGQSYGFVWIDNAQVLAFIRKYNSRIIISAQTKVNDLSQKILKSETATVTETRASSHETGDNGDLEFIEFFMAYNRQQFEVDQEIIVMDMEESIMQYIERYAEGEEEEIYQMGDSNGNGDELPIESQFLQEQQNQREEQQ